MGEAVGRRALGGGDVAVVVEPGLPAVLDVQAGQQAVRLDHRDLGAQVPVDVHDVGRIAVGGDDLVLHGPAQPVERGVGGKEAGLPAVAAGDVGNLELAPGGEGGGRALGQDLAVEDRRHLAGRLGKLFGAECAKLLQGLGSGRGDAQAGGVVDADLFGGGHRLAGDAAEAGFRDRPGEQALGLGRRHEVVDQDAAGALAEGGDIGRVAAEGRDIGLDPVQGGQVVHHPVVGQRAGGLFGVERRVGEEAQGAQAIVDRDQHHAALGEVGSVIDRQGPGAAGEGAAVDPDHHGPFLAGLEVGGRPDVEGEAVLGLVGPGGRGAHLHAHGAIGGRVADAGPGGGGLGRPPAQVAHRRGGKRDGFETGDLSGDGAVELALGHLDGVGGLGRDRSGQGEGCCSRGEAMVKAHVSVPIVRW